MSEFICSTTFKVIFGIIALLLSYFYGRYAVLMFLDLKHPLVQQKLKFASWKFHQLWLNFLGSLTGWIALFYLAFYRLGCTGKPIDLTAGDIVLALVALLGITGLLPNALSKISSLK